MEVTSRRSLFPAVRSLPRGWIAAAGLLVVVLATPVVSVALGAFGASGDEWGHVSRNLLPAYLGQTAFLVLLSGGLALVLGVGTAWLVTLCSFPGRRFFRAGLVLPLAVPAYIAAYTYAGMLDVTGPVQSLVRSVVPGLSDAFLYWDVMRIEVVGVIFALVLYPYVYFPTRALFERRVGGALEAGRLLGSPPGTLFFRVGLPLARPAAAGGVALVLMEILNDYGAVHYYGVETFTTGIFRAWFSLGDLDTAVRLAAILMLAVFVVLVAERTQRGGARYHGDGGRRTRPLYRLRGWKAWSAVAFCTLPLLFGFLLPVGQLLLWALRTAPDVVDPGFLRMALNSLGLAAASGLLAVAVAVILATAARLDRTPLTRSLSRVAVLGYSVPGAVIAVGVLVTVLALGRIVGTEISVALVTGTVAALLYAYLVRFLAVAYLPVEAGFERIGTSVADAARTLGQSSFGTLRRVELPLLRGSLLAALTLVVVDVLKELPLTLILRPFDFDTLATRAFQLAVDEQLAQSAPAALLVVASASAAVVLLHRTLDRREAS